MNFLFVHQNFPGQYRHVASALAARGHRVVGLGEAHLVRRQTALTKGVTLLGYRMRGDVEPVKDGLLQRLQTPLVRGLAVQRAAAQIRARGFAPDFVGVHIGWGEALFLREVFPESRIQLYCEYFYQPTGGDYGFDPSMRQAKDAPARLRVMNAPLLMSMSVADRGVAPTEWQRDRFPPYFRERIDVVHEGIDTARARPEEKARFAVPGTDLVLTREDRIVTYAARNLEPYRGFHVFMRALPEILERAPGARAVIVGGDDVSYSPRPPQGLTYREIALREVGAKLDASRVHFVPPLPYEQYLALLQVSTAHVYLTYPFVLSWSMLEAMAAECVLVASDTAPVTEVVRDGVNGLLVDFLDPAAIAGRVLEVLAAPERFRTLGTRARRDVVRRYDLTTVCIERQVKLAERLARARGAGG